MTNDQRHQPQPGNHAELLARARWRKSSYSGTDGSCVEVATNLPGIVGIRDSKDPDGPRLVVSPGAWRAFIAGVREGEFGL